MTTEELTNKLKKYDNIDEFMEENGLEFDEKAFQKFLANALQRKGLLKSKLGLSSFVYDIFSESDNRTQKHPRKDMLIKLAFGLELSLEETNRLLILGGASHLRSKIKRESIIIFCINKGYGIDKTDDLLYQYGLQTLRDKDKG